MAEPVRVFVSHHHGPDENTFTARLVGDLRAAGVNAWVDVVDIDHGAFLRQINQALASREWFVLVLSPGALESQWVGMETDVAIQLKLDGRMKDIIPIIAVPINTWDIPPTWITYHRFDATHDYAGALAGVFRALGLHVVDSLVAAGRQYNRREQFAEAIPLFEAALHQNNLCFPALSNVAWAYNSVQRHTDALSASDRAIALDGGHASVHNNRAWALNGLGRFAEGLEESLRAIDLDKSKAGSWNSKAWALLQLARCEEAEGAAREAVLLSARKAGWFLTTLGDTLLCLSRCQEALDVFEQARVASPTIPVLLKHLEERKAQARRCLEASRQREDPSQPTFYAGKIVRWSDDTSVQKNAWLVSLDLKRYWIPDSEVFDCLISNGFTLAGEISSSILDQLPDQSGQWVACGTDSLDSNRVLFRACALRSRNGQYRLELQRRDGNLVMYGPNNMALWDNRQDSDYLIMQESDSNLVTYRRAHGAPWATDTVNSGADRLVVQDDGNLVLYASDGVPVWDRHTGRLR
jgi:tetratricopeptide (TPR) repeat protein